MALQQKDYDERCSLLTTWLTKFPDWKYHYFGAAYTTRLKGLRVELNRVMDYLDTIIKEDTE